MKSSAKRPARRKSEEEIDRLWESVSDRPLFEDLLLSAWRRIFGESVLSRICAFLAGTASLFAIFWYCELQELASGDPAYEEPPEAAVDAWLQENCRAIRYAEEWPMAIFRDFDKAAARNPELLKAKAPKIGSKCGDAGTECVYQRRLDGGSFWNCQKKPETERDWRNFKMGKESSLPADLLESGEQRRPDHS